MGRREQREQIFRLLFRAEFHEPQDMPAQEQLFFEDEEQLGISEKDRVYITGKFEKIYDRLSELDKLINERTQGWDTTRIGKVELTILRLGIFEILYDEEVPGGAAINEAVELAKKYGQESAGGFVNAVLAKFL